MENAIRIQLPLSISYLALEGAVRKQLTGEYIPKPEEGANEPPYAQILEVGLSGPDIGTYNITLRARIKILRTVLKREQVDLLVQARLDYDNTRQQLFVSKFRLDSRTPSSFYNTSLELLANKVAYSQILKKARINVGEILLKQKNRVNGLLVEGLALKGLQIKGNVELVAVQDVTLLPGQVSLKVEVQGKLEAEVLDLSSLLPGQ
ncbi:DUF4403 family protein [Nafulsella turpanensis]|uniref:DUF4403 family protein n=1 Tax=Nafulsella turpanensis TaxID=1265690 RepID=UPI000347EB1F|nr:DUF4403 family protein [Nafulsella turpanensis]